MEGVDDTYNRKLYYFSGYLNIKDGEDDVWYRRFCTIESHSIRCYINDFINEPKMVISIKPSTVVTANTEVSDRFIFVVKNTGDVDHEFEAETEDNRNKWINAIVDVSKKSLQLTKDDFEKICLLGNGSQGVVRLVRRKQTGVLFAMKSVDKKALEASGKTHTIIAERNNLMISSHPFIVKLCYAFQSDNQFHLVLEYAPGGDLYERISRDGKFSIERTKLYIAELALALQYLHSKGIIYRDVKSENVVLDKDGHVRLTDFGWSKQMNGTNLTSTICGTTDFLAPEIIVGKKYTFSTDWWALGLLMYEMLTGEFPFEQDNRKKMLYDILKTEPNYNRPEFTPEAVEVMKALLSKEPSGRPDLEKLKKFQFFSDLDFDKVYRKEYKPEFIPEVNNIGDCCCNDSEHECPSDCQFDSHDGLQCQNVPGFSYENEDVSKSPVYLDSPLSQTMA